MDKDILRIIILVIGAVAALGVVILDRLKKRKIGKPLEFQRFEPFDGFGSVDTIPRKDREAGFEVDSFEAAGEKLAAEEALESQEPDEAVKHQETSSVSLPEIIQLAVVAQSGEGFNGVALTSVLESTGLELGEMGIYHRHDAVSRERMFSVASMVEPGSFPSENIDSFHTPGLLFFMQPAELANPVETFDELIQTIHKVAETLGGEEWDAQRKPLTIQSLNELRQSLTKRAI